MVGTYLEDDVGINKAFVRVGRGRLLLTDEGEADEVVPDEIWSRATPRHQVTLTTRPQPPRDRDKPWLVVAERVSEFVVLLRSNQPACTYS
jgi:hypothetical protein